MVGGLKLLFDAALDGAAWPGPLTTGSAVFGEAWCGPLALLQRLETELGLLADHPRPTERALDLAQQLESQTGFWSESFDADPLATAARLLADRDLLALWGWRGQSVGARLDSLWTVTENCTLGIADRLRLVTALVPRRSLDIASITVFEPVHDLPPLWRELFVALDHVGVHILHAPLAHASARGDLAAARTSPFRPIGDGALTMLRTQAPLAAAEEVAATLAACGSLDGVVVVGTDDILDAALGHHGLPKLGTTRGAIGSSALVRLVVETAFTPMNPDDLHALICADPGPVHARLKRRLVGALNKFPARGSAVWLKALEDGLAKVEDEKREGVATRFAALVDPVVARGEALSLEQLTSRMHALSSWAHGRASSEPTVRTTALLADRLVGLARQTRATSFDHTTLRRLLDTLDAPPLSGVTAEVGLASVTSPGAVVGPARVVVWWSFTRNSAPSSVRLRLSAAERAALLAAGVTPPDTGALMAAEARRWRRPLEQATESLLLVCPRVDDAGERAHPHPLWDELVASLPEPRDAAKLVRAQMAIPAAARRRLVALRPVVVPVAEVRVPPLELGDPESPSSLEMLLGCSLAWALQRKGSLWGGLGTGPGSPSPLHYGNIAHLVLEQVFGEKVASPAHAAARAEAVFDGQLGLLAEALRLPDYQTHRAELKRGVVRSAYEVATIVQKTGARVRGLELEVTGKLGNSAVAGRTDLMLDEPNAIIDFKWGFGTYRKLLTTGTAFQLVAYAALTKTGGKLPDVAYLTLQRQQLLAPAGSKLPDARTFSAHTADDMLTGAVARLDERKTQLANGLLQAPSAIEDIEEGELANGVMTIAPKCKYCDLGAICGRRMRP